VRHRRRRCAFRKLTTANVGCFSWFHATVVPCHGHALTQTRRGHEEDDGHGRRRDRRAARRQVVSCAWRQHRCCFVPTLLTLATYSAHCHGTCAPFAQLHAGLPEVHPGRRLPRMWHALGRTCVRPSVHIPISPSDTVPFICSPSSPTLSMTTQAISLSSSRHLSRQPPLHRTHNAHCGACAALRRRVDDTVAATAADSVPPHKNHLNTVTLGPTHTADGGSDGGGYH